MFETLYKQAKRHHAQVVKGNYYNHRTRPVTKSVFHRSYYRLPYGCLLTQDERIEAARRIPCIWSGIYETKMLRENSISFLETPGASYQDTSFVLKVWATVERAVLDEHAFLHYRSDNEASSVRQNDKVYYINKEFQSAYAYCVGRHGRESGFIKSLRCRQAVAYLWNYGRIADEFKQGFLERMRDEFVEARDAGELDHRYFWQREWDAVHQILEDPDTFLSGQRIGEPSGLAGDSLVLSLIVNACGCGEHIGICFESIAYQDLSGVEVVCVDDQSSSAVSTYLESPVVEAVKTIVVRDAGASVASLMKEAVATARGAWILFIDGSSALELDAIKGLKSRLVSSAADVMLLRHDVFDMAQGKLVFRGQGVDLGRRRDLKVINAQSDARSILQVADPHVFNKAFRRSFVERERLDFLGYDYNFDIAFCEMGLLHASAIEVCSGVPIDVLTGMDVARNAALRLCPEDAVNSWLELFEIASEQGLLLPYEKTILNAAAQQLALDMESLSECYGERAALCRAIGGSRSLAYGIPCRSESYYLSEWVYQCMCGAVQAVAFAREYRGMSEFFG